MKTISTKNEIKKFGLYTAFFTVSFSIMQAVLGTHYENDTTSNIVGLLILVGGITACGLNFKKINDLSNYKISSLKSFEDDILEIRNLIVRVLYVYRYSKSFRKS